jgi:hypothetical protein
VLTQTAFGDDPGAAALEDFTKNVGGIVAKRAVDAYVGDFLADGVISWTVDQAKDFLRLDESTSDSSTDRLAPVFYDFQVTTVRVAFVYNPYTHYVVATMSSEASPGAGYVVIYQVDNHGERLPSSTPTLTTITLGS